MTESPRGRVRSRWEQRAEAFLSNRFTYLFLAMIAMLAITPLRPRHDFFVPILFLTLLITVLKTLDIHRGLFRFCAILAAIGFGCHVAGVGLDPASPYAGPVTIVGLVGYASFLAAAIILLLKKLFSDQVVTGETIMGAVSAYFLMGLLWAFFYEIVWVVSPDAISFPVGKPLFGDMTYFSFTTLTTLGYGDTTPVSSMAKNLTILESTLGQIFMTVLIARLVGLHIAREQANG